MLYITVLAGILLFLIGLNISRYSKSFSEKNKKLNRIKNSKKLSFIEIFTNRYPLKILSEKLNNSLSYFMLEEAVQRRTVALAAIFILASGLLLFSSINMILNLWYTKLVTLILCIMVPYYIFTLIIDYMKYNLRLKIPVLIDSFKSSFISHNRIKPALLECSQNIDKRLGNIILKVSDSSDLNNSLSKVRDRLNDPWFNIFVALLMNYRENGGELIKQLYKLSKTITRYNNIEKKKNKRLIWYEFFALAASIFSLPTIIILNKIILGTNIGLYYDTTSSFARIILYSLGALLTVRILRRL